jgi:tetratricopeptide (TPR) repeat protein
MKRRFPLICVACLALGLWTAPALALDQIRTAKGTAINGTIEEANPREIALKLPNGDIDRIPVNEIEYIKFNGEPPQLNVGRTAALGGRYEDALRVLEKLESEKIDRAEVQQDLQYLQAFCLAKLALAGGGDILAAGKQMREFVQKNASSYRFLEASELLGDIFTAINKPDLAAQQYAAVERGAPWEDVKMRARIAKGHALLSQGKPQDALAEFDGALSLAGKQDSPLVARQQQSAHLGKAACLAASGKPADGITLVESVISAADPEQSELFARAYNTLGTCLRAAGKKKEALLAFLHVDVLYAAQAQAHAEALKNLTELWPEVGQPQRAVEAQELLKSRYPNSRWAKG